MVYVATKISGTLFPLEVAAQVHKQRKLFTLIVNSFRIFIQCVQEGDNLFFLLNRSDTTGLLAEGRLVYPCQRLHSPYL